MRSHMMKFYADERRLKQEAEDEDEDDFESMNSYSSPTSSESEESEGVKLVDHEFSVVLQDRESETESSKKKSGCRRSKRVRKPDLSMAGFLQEKRSKYEGEALSSISETTPEEHVAHCLIMMSRDKWEKEEEQEEEDSEVAVKVIRTKVRGKYRCEECNKLFRSYQALGGHRASHKKIKFTTAQGAPPPRPVAVEEKVHQCPFCPRIFSSGQALGGHKRSHFIGGGAISTNFNNQVKKESRIVEALNIDLNLPAPIEDDETSQIAVSAVSDAEFVNNLKD